MPGCGGRDRRHHAGHYWNNVANTKPEAQGLLERLCLLLPSYSFGFQPV